MRLSQKIKKGLLLLIFFWSILLVSAQKSFKYEASIQKIPSNGFYKISLHPGFIAKSNADFSDIRVIDQKGHFVPYITANNLPKPDKEKFIVFPQVFIKSRTDTGTVFVIESVETAPVNTLWVKLKNTAVKRSVNLSGSDDLKRWFAIKEDIPLHGAELSSDGTYLQSLSFPASNYNYLKLLVNDKNKAPIKFLEAGIYTERSPANLYWPIPQAKITKKDSNKVTYITIQLNDNYLVNELNLDITAPKYYKRDVSVYQIDKQNYQFVGNAELNSNKHRGLLIEAKTNKLELQIANGDNLPLSIKNVELSQADQYIVSYLDTGQSYKLLTGDVRASAPDYDLKFFTDSIHGYLNEIIHETVIKNTSYNIQPKIAKREYSVIIWGAIIIVLLLLSLLTGKMIKDVNSKKTSS